MDTAEHKTALFRAREELKTIMEEAKTALSARVNPEMVAKLMKEALDNRKYKISHPQGVALADKTEEKTAS